MMLGIIATINNELDFDTAQLVCSEFGVDLEMKLAETAEDALEQGEAGPFADLLRRAVDGSSPVPPSTPPALLAAVGEMGDVARAGLVDTEASRAIPAGGRVED